jgi:hypothetical protein
MTPRILSLTLVVALLSSSFVHAGKKDPQVVKSAERGLEWLAKQQKRGYWEANGGQYRVAMTALSGIAFISEGSTTTRGKYAENIEKAVDYQI